jgi:oxygen-independent coproporphyrinogen-3 oxidase
MESLDKSQQSAGIYIHIPFCRSKCHYCSFYSETDLGHIPDFLKALNIEMDLYRQIGLSFDTIYIGGGTPSLLSPQQVVGILDRLTTVFQISAKVEITMEANPADISRNNLRILRKCGINRLNIGIQSFDEQVLQFLGRRHTVHQSIRSINDACLAGLDNIGIDLMYGIPGQNLSDWLRSISKAIDTAVPHLSCYELTVDAETHLGRSYATKEFEQLKSESSLNFFLKTSDMLSDAGYIHYEVSNYARGLTFKSQHNSRYWKHGNYLGLGPAAHSFYKKRRWWNHRFIASYISALHHGVQPIEDSEDLASSQLAREALMLGLRTSAGTNVSDLSQKYGVDFTHLERNWLKKLEQEGFVRLEDGWIRPTVKGLAVADRLALMMDEAILTS